MSSEISFNPDALTLQPGDLTIQLTIQLTTIQKLKYDIYLARPEGDFLSHLIEEIERIPEPDGCQASTAHDKAEFANIVLGIAALEQTVSPEAIRLVNQALEYLMPRIHFFWRSLQLFKAVTRYANAHSVELPESMRDAKQAFGCSVLRAVTAPKYDSKTPYRKVLTAAAKALKKKENPFGDACPEDREFVQYAFQFSHWDEEKRLDESHLPNSERQRLGALRKDIRDALSNYGRSMRTLSSYYKNTPNLVSVQVDSQKRQHIIGPKGKLFLVE